MLVVMNIPADCMLELNSFTCGTRVDCWPGKISSETTPAELIEISRRCLLTYWKEDDKGSLVPQNSPTEETPIPDEVVVRAPDGRALYRRTIVDEKIDRWFAER